MKRKSAVCLLDDDGKDDFNKENNGKRKGRAVNTNRSNMKPLPLQTLRRGAKPLTTPPRSAVRRSSDGSSSKTVLSLFGY